MIADSPSFWDSVACFSTIKAHLKACAELIGRVEALLLELVAKGEPRWKINKIAYFLKHAVQQINQIDRRLLKGEMIPHNEKVFSIFEPHTRWISKGKAGRPVESGVQVCISNYSGCPSVDSIFC